MKLNIVRAWKDEVYRQGLSDEQMGMLPANPAGEQELTNAELQSVYGGDGVGPMGAGAPAAAALPVPLPIGGAGSGSAAAAAAISRESFHSFAFFCQENLFSLNANTGFNLLSPVNNVCVNGDN